MSHLTEISAEIIRVQKGMTTQKLTRSTSQFLSSYLRSKPERKLHKTSYPPHLQLLRWEKRLSLGQNNTWKRALLVIAVGSQCGGIRQGGIQGSLPLVVVYRCLGTYKDEYSKLVFDESWCFQSCYHAAFWRVLKHFFYQYPLQCVNNSI